MISVFQSLPVYQQFSRSVQDGATKTGLGVMRSARLPLLAALQHDLKRPVLLLTNRSDRALALADELPFWSPSIIRQVFPAPNPLFYEIAAWASTTRRDRLQALAMLASYHLPGIPRPEKPPVIVAPLRAVMTRTLPRRDFLLSSKLIKVGQTLIIESLIRSWVDIGYRAVDTVLEAGQFSRRGGILDIWTPAESAPLRLDFFGDELETLRRFDPASQRTLEKLDQLWITPAREVLPGKAHGVIPDGQEVEDFSLPLVHSTPTSLLDYLPKDTLLILDDLDGLSMVASDMEERAVRTRTEAVQEGILPPDFPVPYVTWSEILDRLDDFQWLDFGRVTPPGDSEIAHIFTPGERFAGRLKPLLESVADGSKQGDPFMLVSRQAPRLQELWRDQQGNDRLDLEPQFLEGSLSEGWNIYIGQDRQFHLLTDSEIFGWERPRPRQQQRAVAMAPEASYADLKPGDWVVHIEYGIGQFTGLVARVVDGNEREFLQIEYDAGDVLFVPVHQADRLTRYVGTDNNPPHPTRLGTPEWSGAKQRAREAVMEVAHELLELYAQRQVVEGHAFSKDQAWQQELEASFPYVETADQKRAIEDVKRDMENKRPMDRLLCGDVGYGKTEVALRAAFKAVMDGKQVGVLVPTTVLAQQHFETFRQRLSAYPVTVEMLSRFRTPREQDQILKRVYAGDVDILIGTHRLVQPDVVFKDLGLVIIDEEQRFGVTHKEFMKRLRTEVDVLTLTATPIPRTLYMALTGVRDISTINTPPEERLPIVTHIGPYSPKLVRQAILRELERGGQVFFVHNRVQTIYAMQMHLNRLTPEARVGVAHGQLPEGELSKVMRAFNQGEIDVLLCTSIIESGLDIPNANTLIVDRGDTFGLAQLYQLRGRVGRGAQRAYAYFFRHKRRTPTPEGQERLEVIAENTQLGSGYSIAMRDLEMRGAGELLGTRQHGTITAVGFHLYTRLLAQAVRDLRRAQGLPQAEGKVQVRELAINPVTVDLSLPVGIPIFYVADQDMRLSLYRRIADLSAEDEIDALMDEFNDRFGPVPEAVRNLFFQMHVKLLAEKIGLSSVTLEGDQLVLRYPPLPEGVTSRNLPEMGEGVRAGKNAYWLAVAGEEDWQKRLAQLLQALLTKAQGRD